MGIDGLLPLLRPITQKQHISHFQRQRLGIDASSWMYKGCYLNVMAMEAEDVGTMSYSCIDFFIKMISLLESYAIEPVFVFDGRMLPMKTETCDRRRSARNAMKQKGSEMLSLSQIEEGRKLLSRSITISEAIISETMSLLKQKNIRFIVAPYESDSQLAKLKQLNLIEAVVSEDSDMLVYGCNTIYKLNENGECDYIDLSNTSSDQVSSVYLKSFLRMEWSLKISACVLAGCDYVDSIKGIGLKRAISYFEKYENLSELIFQLAQQPAYVGKIEKQYQEKVTNASKIFKHALVYNPILHLLEPYTEIPQVDDDENCAYITGVPYDEYLSCGIYCGEYEPRNLNKRIFSLKCFEKAIEVINLGELEKENKTRMQLWEREKVRKDEEIEGNMMEAVSQIAQFRGIVREDMRSRDDFF